MTKIVSKPDYSNPVGSFEGKFVITDQRLQIFFDDIEQRLNDFLLGDGVRLPTYTVSSLPSVPVTAEPAMIFVSDASGGSIMAFSNGTNWLRCDTSAIIT